MKNRQPLKRFRRLLWQVKGMHMAQMHKKRQKICVKGKKSENPLTDRCKLDNIVTEKRRKRYR